MREAGEGGILQAKLTCAKKKKKEVWVRFISLPQFPLQLTFKGKYF